MGGVVGHVHHQLSSHTTSRGGCIEHQFKPDVALNYLELASHLRPTSNIGSVLASSSSILLGDADGASELNIALRSGRYQLPQEFFFRKARLKLDVLNMVYMQKWFLRFKTLHYMLLDSSPQLGYNFMAVLETIIVIPESCCVNIIQRMRHDLNKNWDTWLQPLSTHGLGRAGGLRKSITTSNLILMHSDSLRSFDALRDRYRACTSDKGAEKHIQMMPVDIVPAKRNVHLPGDPAKYLYPNMLGIADSLHIFWNGFEIACKNSTIFKAFEDILSAVCAFASDSELMRKMRAVCCEDDEAMAAHFYTKATVRIDWRWESMLKALDTAGPMWGPLQQKFDQQKLLSSEAGSMMKNTKVKNLGLVLQEQDFMARKEMFHVIGKIISKYAGLMEICDCHKELWATRNNFKKRQKLMSSALDRPSCVWQGRRLPWFISEGYNELMADLSRCTSQAMQDELVKLAPDKRATLLEASEAMRSALKDYYAADFAYLFHVPHIIIGVFYCAQGGGVARARELITIALAEVDAVVEAGKVHTLDRLTRKCLIGLASQRADAERFRDGVSDNLLDFPSFYVFLQEYALASGVSRAIEKVHADIKRIGSYKWNINPPYLSALCREKDHLKRLRDDIEFKKFCIDSWFMRRLVERVLHLRTSSSSLKPLSWWKKIKIIYQCTIDDNYGDISSQQAGYQEFVARTQEEHAPHLQIHDCEKMVVQYLKSMFQPGIFYTMPSDLFNMCLADEVSADVDSSGCVKACLEGALMDDVEFDSSSAVAFMVMNNRPESRNIMHQQHLSKSLTSISVKRYILKTSAAHQSRVIVMTDDDSTMQSSLLNLAGIITNIGRTVRETRRWIRYNNKVLMLWVHQTCNQYNSE